MIQPVLSFQAVCSISSIMKQGYTFGHSQNEMTRFIRTQTVVNSNRSILLCSTVNDDLGDMSYQPDQVVLDMVVSESGVFPGLCHGAGPSH